MESIYKIRCCTICIIFYNYNIIFYNCIYIIYIPRITTNIKHKFSYGKYYLIVLKTTPIIQNQLYYT